MFGLLQNFNFGFPPDRQDTPNRISTQGPQPVLNFLGS